MEIKYYYYGGKCSYLAIWLWNWNIYWILGLIVGCVVAVVGLSSCVGALNSNLGTLGRVFWF